MAKTPENTQIKRDRRHIVHVLNMCYPGFVDGEEVYRTVVDMNPSYTRVYCVKDMNYLHEMGYVNWRRADGCERLNISVKECQFKLTATGTNLANRLIDDPAISI